MKSLISTPPLPSIQLIRQFREILREHDEHATSAGAKRTARWTGNSGHSTAESGNTANAAAVSKENIRKVCNSDQFAQLRVSPICVT